MHIPREGGRPEQHATGDALLLCITANAQHEREQSLRSLCFAAPRPSPGTLVRAWTRLLRAISLVSAGPQAILRTASPGDCYQRLAMQWSSSVIASVARSGTGHRLLRTNL